MNEKGIEPEDADSAMKDAPAGKDPAREIPAAASDQRRKSNPDDVKDGSAQDGRQPLAGA